MKALIVYYSRTGTTAKVASALATALDATIVEIKCPRYRSGWFRYLLAGYGSVKGRLPPIDVPDMSQNDYDLVLLGAPIWTSYPALPLRSFIAKKLHLPARIGLFLTYGGHSPPEKAVDFVSALMPTPLVASLELPQEQVVAGLHTEAVDAFVRRLNVDDE